MNRKNISVFLRRSSIGLAIASLFASGVVTANPGDKAGAAVLVNATVPVTPATARNSAGEIVVVWSEFAFGASNGGIFAQLFAADGTPASPGFPVSTPTSDFANSLRVPRVAMNDEGAFVVTWVDDHTRSAYVRRFAAGGVPLGDQVVVARGIEGIVSSSGPDGRPQSSVAIDNDGDFTVAWTSESLNGLSIDLPYPIPVIGITLPGIDRVYARAYGADGAQKAPAALVDARPILNGPLSNQSVNKSVAVAMDQDGDYIVVYSLADAQKRGRLFGRRYNANGRAAAARFRIDDGVADAGESIKPSVSINASGRLAVSWTHRLAPLSGGSTGSAYQIRAKAYAADGNVAVAEFDPFAGVQALPSYDYGAQSSIAIDSLGNFVIATNEGAVGTNSHVFTRLFAASGTPSSGKIALGSSAATNQSIASVAVDGAGNPAVTWIDFLFSNPTSQLLVQRLVGP